jgi:hypothetical protein
MIVENLKSRRVAIGAVADVTESVMEPQPYPTTSPSSTTTTQIISGALIPLVGIIRLQVRWSHDVAVRQGITSNFMQPWYNKPVEIDIQGESYIGALGATGVGAALNSINLDAAATTSGAKTTLDISVATMP